jgi:hypothetical protein
MYHNTLRTFRRNLILVEIMSLLSTFVIWWRAPFGGGHTLLSLAINALVMLLLGYVVWWVCRWAWKRLWLRSFRKWSRGR